MKKILTALLVISLFSALCAVPVFAADVPRLVDDAHLLTSSEVKSINRLLDELSDELSFDIAVYTCDALGYYSPSFAAGRYYDQHGFRTDGVILLISMEERDWCITVGGNGETLLDEKTRSYVGNVVQPYLSDGDYAEAFTVFADLCGSIVESGLNGEKYEIPADPSETFERVLIALAVGLVVAAIAVAVMKAKLKTVRLQPAARAYIVDDSLNVTHATERFLYTHVDKTRRSDDNDSHHSSHSSGGGGSHHSSTSGHF